MTQNEILLETGDFLLLEDGSKVLNETQPIVGNATMEFAVTTATGNGRERFVGNGTSTSTTQMAAAGRERFIGNGSSTSLVTQANGTGTNFVQQDIAGDGSMVFPVTAGSGVGHIPVPVQEGGGDYRPLPKKKVRPRTIRGYGDLTFSVTGMEGEGRITRKRARREKVAPEPVMLHGGEAIIPLAKLPPPDPIVVEQIQEAIRGLGQSLARSFKAEGRGRVTPPKIKASGTFVGPGFAAAGRGRVTPPEVVPVEVEPLVRELVGIRLDELMTDADLFE